MFRKSVVQSFFIMILVMMPLTALSADAPPPWAESVMAELGCMAGMFGKMEGNVFVDGMIMDDGAKLKERGFTITAGAPYRVSVTQINKGKYEVSVKRMDQPGASEMKILEIK